MILEDPLFQRNIKTIQEVVDHIGYVGDSVDDIHSNSYIDRYNPIGYFLKENYDRLFPDSNQALENLRKKITNDDIVINDYTAGWMNALKGLYYHLLATGMKYNINAFDISELEEIAENNYTYLANESINNPNFILTTAMADITSDYEYPEADLGIIAFAHYYINPDQYVQAIAKRLEEVKLLFVLPGVFSNQAVIFYKNEMNEVEYLHLYSPPTENN